MRYIQIKEILIPGIHTQIPEERWTEDEKRKDRCDRTEELRIHTGRVMHQMAIRPLVQVHDQQGGVRMQPAINDYAAQKKSKDLIKTLDPDRDGKADAKVGEWVALENAWYDLIIQQADIWPWDVQAPEIFDLIEEWHNAPSEDPRDKPASPDSFGENHHEPEPEMAMAD